MRLIFEQHKFRSKDGTDEESRMTPLHRSGKETFSVEKLAFYRSIVTSFTPCMNISAPRV
jgi:hypothetical protein